MQDPYILTKGEIKRAITQKFDWAHNTKQAERDDFANAIVGLIKGIEQNIQRLPLPVVDDDLSYAEADAVRSKRHAIILENIDTKVKETKDAILTSIRRMRFPLAVVADRATQEYNLAEELQEIMKRCISSNLGVSPSVRR